MLCCASFGLGSVVDCDSLICFSQVLKTAEGDVLIDYSKNLINQDVMKLLFDLVSPHLETRLVFLRGHIQATRTKRVPQCAPTVHRLAHFSLFTTKELCNLFALLRNL